MRLAFLILALVTLNCVNAYFNKWKWPSSAISKYIRSVNCSLPNMCSAPANIGDNVQVRIDLGRQIKKTYPPAGIKCDRRRQICITILDETTLSIVGKLQSLPFVVRAFFHDGGNGFVLRFFNETEEEDDMFQRLIVPGPIKQQAITGFESYVNKMECSSKQCTAMGKQGDTVNIFYDTGIQFHKTVPSSNVKCDPSWMLCITQTGETSLSIVGRLPAVPYEVKALDVWGRPVFSWKFSDASSDKDSAHPPNPPNKSITTMQCSSNSCWTLSKKGDFVDFTYDLDFELQDTKPSYGVKCDPRATICITKISDSRVSLIGTLPYTPFEVKALDRRWNERFSWKFLNQPRGSGRYALTKDDSMAPMDCSARSHCSMVAKKGDFVNQIVDLPPGTHRTTPPANVKCHPKSRICVTQLSDTELSIMGKVPYVPFKVSATDRQGTEIFAWIFTETPANTDGETEAVNEDPSPNKMKHISEMSCSRENFCSVQARVGDTIFYILQTKERILATDPEFDIACNPFKQLCVTSNDNSVSISGTVQETPFQIYVYGFRRKILGVLKIY